MLHRLEGALIFLDELQGQLRKERIAADSGECDQKVNSVTEEEKIFGRDDGCTNKKNQ